ncbi:MAG: O-acetyl-ADP-ribose deacetylase [Ignavibacteriae bacterium]|nr:O-acetyl-ADP-ribose deacetylase [Ignavibacteriota bacterium]
MDANIRNKIEIVSGDITTQDTDAIVNAANNSLLGGSGVDGAIHRAAGKELLIECKTLKGCETGGAKITKGYNLKSRYIIHTAGPVWHGGNHNEAELLKSCYRKSLELAALNNLFSISFPAISTGVYSFPIKQATEIAITETANYLKANESFEKVRFVCFDENTYQVYLETAKELFR